MKILIVNDYKERIGGAESYLWNLKDALEAKGHKVEVFGSDVSKEEYYKSQKNKDLKKYLFRIFNPISYLQIRRLIGEFKPDVIHVHNIFNELSPSIFLASGNIPVIMTVHDNMLVNAVSILSERTGKECKKRTCGGCGNCVGWKGAIYETVKRKIYKIMLKKIKLFITPSQYMNDFIKEAGLKPVITIPNGIKLFSYSKIYNYNTLLYVGRLAKEKGVEYLLDAMPDVIKSIPEIKLLLVGDGPDKKYFESVAKEMGITQNIRFVGNVGKEEIEKYYKESTIVVVPSIYPDNFPTVCIEAMSVGRPIIGANIGGIPELVKQDITGVLIKPKYIKDIIQSILKLLSNKNKLLIMSATASKKSLRYNVKNHTNKIGSMYQNLLKAI